MATIQAVFDNQQEQDGFYEATKVFLRRVEEEVLVSQEVTSDKESRDGGNTFVVYLREKQKEKWNNKEWDQFNKVLLDDQQKFNSSSCLFCQSTGNCVTYKKRGKQKFLVKTCKVCGNSKRSKLFEKSKKSKDKSKVTRKSKKANCGKMNRSNVDVQALKAMLSTGNSKRVSLGKHGRRSGLADFLKSV